MPNYEKNSNLSTILKYDVYSLQYLLLKLIENRSFYPIYMSNEAQHGLQAVASAKFFPLRIKLCRTRHSSILLR